MKIRWQFGIFAGIVLALFCLYPQFKMVYLRGAAWNGHYAYNDIDEVAYASYVRALIDGRPRKNDPYSGRDDSPATPQPESLFSIQFIAPYTIAIPARILGVGTPWGVTIAGAVAGFFAALAAFWLIARMTGSSWFGMAGSIALFAGGALAAGEGAILEILFDGFSYPYFPGFRRYIPALALTALFGMFSTVWKIVEPDSGEDDLRPKPDGWPRYIPPLIAALCFTYTVYSYFYMWTTAAAFLGCLFVAWIAERPGKWRVDVKLLALTGVACVAALGPYVYLLSRRSESLEHVQLLVFTRAPDLFRMPEYIGLAVLLILIAGLATRRIKMGDPSTLFTLALALVPFMIFNQQIVSGRSLQPIHYQVFVGNYVAGLALVLALGIVFKRELQAGATSARLACLILTAAGITWGIVECHFTVRVLDDANVERDRQLPVARRLEELSAFESDPHRMTVFASDMIQGDDLPSVAPQNVLWARHQHVFAGLSWEESKERYYQYLYYLNVDEEGLDYLLKNDFASQIALFGWGRHTDRLSFDAKPLTYGEVDAEVKNYAAYRSNFSRTQATSPLLSYVVVNNRADTDLSVIDRWYSRDEGEVVGKYTLYRVWLKDP